MRYRFVYDFKKPHIYEISVLLLDLGINFAVPIPFGEIIAWRKFRPYSREKLLELMWKYKMPKDIQQQILKRYEEINRKIHQQLVKDMWLG